jgi:hypothetical protein
MSSFELHKKIASQHSMPLPPKNKLAPSTIESNDSGSTQGHQSGIIPGVNLISRVDHISIASTIFGSDDASILSQEEDTKRSVWQRANLANCSVISEKPLNWAQSSVTSERGLNLLDSSQPEKRPSQVEILLSDRNLIMKTKVSGSTIRDPNKRSIDEAQQQSEGDYQKNLDLARFFQNTRYMILQVCSVLNGNLCVGYYWFLYNELWDHINSYFGVEKSDSQFAVWQGLINASFFLGGFIGTFGSRYLRDVSPKRIFMCIDCIWLVAIIGSAIPNIEI